MRTVVLGAAVLGSLAAPSVASGHVGKSPPVATDFLARVTRPLPGIKTQIVDGDQTLWLNARHHTVSIRGIQGEPLLLFDSRGVWLNVRSLTAQADQIDRFDLRPTSDARARPLWHRLSRKHAFAWHEHRLHLLEPVARNRMEPGLLGTWSIPFVVDGRPELLVGVLRYVPPPSLLRWLGFIGLLAIGGSFATVRSRRATVSFALAAVPIVWELRVARELYGRPTVGVGEWIQVALTALVGAALLFWLVRNDFGVRLLVAFLVSVGSLYQGLSMYSVLTRSTALTSLPTEEIRLAVALALGLALAVLVGSVKWLSQPDPIQSENGPLADDAKVVLDGEPERVTAS